VDLADSDNRLSSADGCPKMQAEADDSDNRSPRRNDCPILHGASGRGLLTRRELRALGVNRGSVVLRRLVEVFSGVYSLSPALAPLALEEAALLSVGPPSTLSNRTATTLWRLLPSPELPGPVHVTVWGRNCRRKGIRIHRAVRPPDTTKRHGLAVTTPNQTLLDLAATEPTATTERALNEAYAQRLTTRSSLLAFLAQHRGKPGAARLESLTTDTNGFTRSQAERALAKLVRRAALPPPILNARIHGYEVDALWPDHKLVVEVDGYATHHSRESFERDRRKAADLQRRGLTVIRLSWRQLTSEPEATAALLASLLVRA
jgi:very-short-patch-repair endonuclease